MTQKEHSLPVKVLKALFPDSHLIALAYRHKVIERSRKIEITPFFWTLILGFGIGAKRKIAQLRRTYEASAGQNMASSAFYYRFSGRLCRFLRALLLETLEKTNSFKGELYGKMSSFRDLIVADSTIIKLHDFLSHSYPGTRTNHSVSSAKVHLVMSLGKGIPRDVKLKEGKKSDQNLLNVGSWAQGCLFLMDLGYYKYQLLNRLDRNGAFFISRLKKSANPTIVAQHTCCRGRSICLVGQKLKEVLPFLKRQSIDIEVEVSFKNRKYKNQKTTVTKRFRVVGVLVEGEYHFYITNIPTESLSSHEISQAYRARWEIEIIFKQLKTHYRIHQLNTKNKEIVESLIYIAILTMIASKVLHREILLRERLSPRDIPTLRWTSVFAALSGFILYEMMEGYFEKDVDAFWRILIHEAKDPNKGRPLICGQWGGVCL